MTTELKEVERFKVGFANDWTGATHKYLILDETKSGKYRVSLFIVSLDTKGEKFWNWQPVEIKDKSEITDIHEETLEGERI